MSGVSRAGAVAEHDNAPTDTGQAGRRRGGARGEVRATEGGPWTRTSARNGCAACVAAGRGNRSAVTASPAGLDPCRATAALVSAASRVWASGVHAFRCGRAGEAAWSDWSATRERSWSCVCVAMPCRCSACAWSAPSWTCRGNAGAQRASSAHDSSPATTRCTWPVYTRPSAGLDLREKAHARDDIPGQDQRAARPAL